MTILDNFKRRKFKESISGYDRWLNISVGLMLLIGTLLVYAATKQWFASQGLDPQYYLKRHILNMIIGGLLAYGTTLIDYRLIRAYTPFVYIAGLVGLLAVLITPFGSEVNGARSWISFPGGFQLQPAELAKISVIIGMAMILSEGRDRDENPGHSDVLKALLVAAVPLLLIIIQPDLGETLI
ncbi:MAG: rod shape-determining protein RodA, partial [Actinobacteria bacterium]|nr:rod shape-determining protein RodA [Actinomycetota bacterium]